MAEAQKKRKAHHGENIRTGRRWKGFSQEDLAERMGIMQSDVSKIEQKAVVELKVLQQIAQILNVDVNFLETFVPDDVLSLYADNTSSSPTFNDTNTISDNATENETIVMGGTNEYQTINNSVPFGEVKELFNEIRKQDRELADMRALLVKHGIDYASKEE